MITALIILFSIQVSMDIVGLIATANGNTLKVGFGSYLFALAINVAFLFGILVYLV